MDLEKRALCSGSRSHRDSYIATHLARRPHALLRSVGERAFSELRLQPSLGRFAAETPSAEALRSGFAAFNFVGTQSNGTIRVTLLRVRGMLSV